MKTALSLMIAGGLALASAQTGYAQAPAPKTSAVTATPDAATDEAKKAKAKAKECSDQADAKKLHGKARKEFRAKCKRS